MTGLLEPPQAGRDMPVILAKAGIVGQEGKAREERVKIRARPLQSEIQASPKFRIEYS